MPPITAPVPVGKSYDVSVAMVAPSAPGTYTSYWQMADAKGIPFGKQVSVKIQVPAPPTRVPPPTPTPPANVYWAVDRDHIKQGESATFTLKVTGVKNVWFNEKGQPYVGVPGQSTQKVTPARDTTYQLRVEWNTGGFWDDYKTVYVAQAVAPPAIAQFGINPQYETVVGQPVTLWWEVRGVADGIAVLRNGAQVYQTTAVQSSWEDRPPAGAWTYELRAWGPGGSANPAYQQITVKQESPPQPAPDITQFDFSPPGPVLQGSCVNLTWTVQGAVDGQELRANGNPLPIDAGSRSSQDCGCPQNIGACTYELRAWNGSGGDNAGLSVDVIMKTIPGNPCTQNCLDRGGQTSTEQRGDGQEYGVCLFEDGQLCEQCAMMYGTCPVGGLRVTGYDTSAARYCAITGGQYSQEQNTCTISGAVCDAEAHYNGQCP